MDTTCGTHFSCLRRDYTQYIRELFIPNSEVIMVWTPHIWIDSGNSYANLFDTYWLQYFQFVFFFEKLKSANDTLYELSE